MDAKAYAAAAAWIALTPKRVRLNLHVCRNSGGTFAGVLRNVSGVLAEKGKVHTSTVHVCPALRTGQTCIQLNVHFCRNSGGTFAGVLRNVSGVVAEKRKSAHIDGACLSQSD
eukprot:5822524-Amphidinium_carterae.2